MRTTGLALACCAALLLAATPAVRAQRPTVPAARVEVSVPATSLPGPRYAWVPMPASLAAELDSRVQDPNLRARLKAALDRALQAKGYRLSDSARQADILVAYRVGVRNVQQVGTRRANMASAREAGVECRAGGCSQIVTRDRAGTPQVQVITLDTVEGGLQVEVLQPADIRVLWRAMFRGAVRADRESRVDLDSIATRTLANLPRAPSR